MTNEKLHLQMRLEKLIARRKVAQGHIKFFISINRCDTYEFDSWCKVRNECNEQIRDIRKELEING